MNYASLALIVSLRNSATFFSLPNWLQTVKKNHACDTINEEVKKRKLREEMIERQAKLLFLLMCLSEFQFIQFLNVKELRWKCYD